MVNDENVAETLEPVGVDVPAGSDGLDRRALACPEHDSAPQAAIGSFCAEAALHLAAHGVRQALAQAMQGGGLGRRRRGFLRLLPGGLFLLAFAGASPLYLLAGLARGLLVAVRLPLCFFLALALLLGALRLQAPRFFLAAKFRLARRFPAPLFGQPCLFGLLGNGLFEPG